MMGRRRRGMATRHRCLLARLLLGFRRTAVQLRTAAASTRWLVLGCVRPMDRASPRRVGNRGESYSRQEQDVAFSAASSAGFPAGTTGAVLQEEDPAEADRARIIKAIRGSDGDLLLAAELLGVTYAALRKRMAEIGIRVKTSIEIE